MSEVKSHKTKCDSQISLGRKTISRMREICENVFMDSFVSIKVDRKIGMFIVIIDKKVSQRTLDFFIHKYEQCRVKVSEDAVASDHKKKN